MAEEMKCWDCFDGNGWVCLDKGGRGTYRPCQRCNKPAFDRLYEGHFEPDHDCADCRERRSTRVKR